MAPSVRSRGRWRKYLRRALYGVGGLLGLVVLCVAGLFVSLRFAKVRGYLVLRVNSALAGSFKIATQMAEALSSTAQDMIRGKRTEIDSLNGYIAHRGAELGVPTPVNHALYTLVKLAEAEFTSSPAAAA